MTPSLGEKLRAAREQRGISISEVAEQTRISPLYLEAIDSDNYKSLPGGIFNKGFVRSYAKYVGVDEQEALQDYSRIIAQTEPVVEEEFKTYRPEVLTDDRAASSIVPTVIFAAVILGLMTAGILFLVNYIQNQQSEPQIAANTSNVNTAVPAANTVETTPEPVGTAPAMGAIQVEFTANGDEVWLQSVADGRRSEALVKPGSSVRFEPKEQLNLRYSKSRAQFAQLTLNGKSITLPQQPASPSQSSIEVSINQANLPQIWESGEIGFGSPAGVSDNPAATRPATRAPSRPAVSANSNTAATAPAGVPTMTNSGAPRPAATPAVRRPAGNDGN
jgi:cytoskeleton protein RodZ